MTGYGHLEERTRPGEPLVFSFHGTGGDEEQFAALVAGLMPDAGHIAPRGDVDEAGALRFFRRKAEGLYDMDDLAARTAKMTAFLSAQKARLAPSRVTGLGYSNGANILASVAFHAPALFDDLILMHPLIPFRPKATDLSGFRVLITAGERDPIAPRERTETLAAMLAEFGAEVQLDWHPGGHEMRQSEIATAEEFLRSAPGGRTS